MNELILVLCPEPGQLQLLAMLATGLAAKRGEGSRTFKPSMSETERAEHLARWKKALQGVLDAAK